MKAWNCFESLASLAQGPDVKVLHQPANLNVTGLRICSTIRMTRQQQRSGRRAHQWALYWFHIHGSLPDHDQLGSSLWL
jgi:hypothetical protein